MKLAGTVVAPRPLSELNSKVKLEKPVAPPPNTTSKFIPRTSMKIRLNPSSCAALAALLTLLHPGAKLLATTVTNALTVHLKFDGDLLDSTTNGLDGTNVAL